MERSKAIQLHWRTLFTSATLNSPLSSFNSSLQRVISGNPGRPETCANSNRAMELNRELMGVTDSLERLTAEWTKKLAELEQDAG